MQVDSILPLADDGRLALPLVRLSTRPSHQDANEAAPAGGIDVDKVMRDLARAMEPFDIALKFSKDEDTGTIVIQMIDQSTGETLEQIPNEAMLRVATILGRLQGRIFNCKA
jgi:uncharacterized FlaG/YvyC family protein